MKVDVSTGEFFDKLTILHIKLEKIKDEEKLKSVNKENLILTESLPSFIFTDVLLDLIQKLRQINSKLWNIEDKLRVKEKEKRFDSEFVQLARDVYHLNDERSVIKKTINKLTDSELVEEKQYVDYKE